MLFWLIGQKINTAPEAPKSNVKHSQKSEDLLLNLEWDVQRIHKGVTFNCPYTFDLSVHLTFKCITLLPHI